MVFQRVYLFQDTIYNNIIMGKPDATEEEVYEAARKARCYDFIMALPDGFQTVVGEGGATPVSYTHLDVYKRQSLF